MKLLIVLSGACLLLLTSCHSEHAQTSSANSVINQQNSLQKQDAVKSSLISIQRVTEFESNFSNIEEFKSNLNKYIVHANFTGHSEEMTLSCETQSSPHDKKQFQVMFGGKTQTTDLAIDLNDNVAQKETIHCSVNSDLMSRVDADFEVKKDLLISSSEDVTKYLVNGKNYFGTLVLDEGVVAETLGRNLDIRVDQLISNNSTITSFSQKNSKAANDQDGSSGGTLNINAMTAYGSLKIIMRGQDGGDVLKTPKAIETRPVGDASLNGLPMFTEYRETCDDRGDRERCYSQREVTQCPTDGLKGLKGFKGTKAYDGRNGGNSGVASITVADGTLFDLELSLIKGSGSLAGAPGKGGLGSNGGAAGSYDSAFINGCNRAPVAGAMGDTGDVGDAGIAGKNGNTERGTYMDIKNNVKVEY